MLTAKQPKRNGIQLTPVPGVVKRSCNSPKKFIHAFTAASAAMSGTPEIIAISTIA